jgi:transcriptional regulator with XRE-family HTH domain
MDVEAGRRFKEVVDVAIGHSREIHSVAELLRCTGLHPNTLYDIFNGKLEDGPGPRTVNLIADCLHIPTRWLWDAWQGREPEPDSAEEALRRHADAVDRQNRLLGEIVSFVRSAAEAIATEVDLSDAQEAGFAEGLRRGRVPPIDAAPDTPSPSPGRPPRGSGAGRG